MKPQALLLPAIPLLLLGLGWWASGSLVSRLVKPPPAPVVTQVTLPSGVESLAPPAPRPPLGYLELAAFGFTEPPKVVPVKPRPLSAADFYVVDAVLSGDDFHSAIIGNRTVRVGDKLDKTYTVAAIGRDGVWVRARGRRAEQEKIGFRPLDSTPVEAVAAVSETPVARDLPATPAKPPPEGLRDFRQLLEMLKL